ncbi:MAG: molybdopterin converting factor subunit 1 [Acidobacteriota bacterium]
MRILLFARLRDIARAGSLERQVPPACTVEDVWSALAAEWPELTAFRPALSAAVNAEFAPFSALVNEGDEVAFLPPVSGG